MKKANYIIIISFVLLLYNCNNTRKQESFENYNIEYRISYIGIYNFNKNTFQPDFYQTTYSNYLTEKEREKVINKFFNYNMDKKNGDISVFEGNTVPTLSNILVLYRRQKQYLYVSVGNSKTPILSWFISIDKKEIVKFDTFIDSVIISKPKFKEIEDSTQRVKDKIKFIVP